jgi:hypothetical protein
VWPAGHDLPLRRVGDGQRSAGNVISNRDFRQSSAKVAVSIIECA